MSLSVLQTHPKQLNRRFQLYKQQFLLYCWCLKVFWLLRYSKLKVRAETKWLLGLVLKNYFCNVAFCIANASEAIEQALSVVQTTASASLMVS